MSKNSGKSKSMINPQGVRRKKEGKELAPKSLRRKLGVTYLSECSAEKLEKTLN